VSYNAKVHQTQLPIFLLPEIALAAAIRFPASARAIPTVNDAAYGKEKPVIKIVPRIPVKRLTPNPTPNIEMLRLACFSTLRKTGFFSSLSFFQYSDVLLRQKPANISGINGSILKRKREIPQDRTRRLSPEMRGIT
jgi:hypothetical protein